MKKPVVLRKMQKENQVHKLCRFKGFEVSLEAGTLEPQNLATGGLVFLHLVTLTAVQNFRKIKDGHFQGVADITWNDPPRISALQQQRIESRLSALLQRAQETLISASIYISLVPLEPRMSAVQHQRHGYQPCSTSNMDINLVALETWISALQHFSHGYQPCST